MPKSASLWMTYTLGRVLLSKYLQLSVFIHTKIQLPVITLWSVVLPNDFKAQLIDIEFSG